MGRKANTGSVFRSPTTNARYTRNLFWEVYNTLADEYKTIEPMYSLHRDVPGLVNFRRVYVELADPTGYKVSQQLLEDYDHWQLLMKSPWFREAKALWDAELDAKLASEGLTAIRMFADGLEGVAPAVQLSAAKYLADRTKPKTSRGRPSRDEIAGELKREAGLATELSDDAARISLVK